MMHETEEARRNPAPRDDRVQLTASDIGAAAMLAALVAAAGMVVCGLVWLIGGA